MRLSRRTIWSAVLLALMVILIGYLIFVVPDTGDVLSRIALVLLMIFLPLVCVSLVRRDTEGDEKVAELEEALAELRYARDYFEGIVENSADMIITVNPRGYIYTFNKGAEEALGYERGEMIGRPVEQLFEDPSEQATAANRLKGTDNVVNYETRLRTKGGELRDVILTMSRLKDAEGHSIGSFGIAKDVTNEKRMQRDLVGAERFAAIGQAVAGIQHSMKNMLNVMKGGAYMVKLGMKKEKQDLLEEGWEMVEGAIASLTSMSSGMLKYVKEWKPEFAQVDVAEMVREIEGIFRSRAEDKGVTLTVTVPDGPSLVHCDAKLLHSAVMDILSNALDACMERSYEGEEGASIGMTAHPSESNGTYVVSVRDNGCGMSPEVMANVFTPLFSTKKKWGTGLGLALTARTIRQHGGEIEVESEVNVGSEFRIIIPTSGPERS